jgi:hypothetical protein
MKERRHLVAGDDGIGVLEPGGEGSPGCRPIRGDAPWTLWHLAPGEIERESRGRAARAEREQRGRGKRYGACRAGRQPGRGKAAGALDECEQVVGERRRDRGERHAPEGEQERQGKDR